MLQEWTFQVFHRFGGWFPNAAKWIKVTQGHVFMISRNGQPFPITWRIFPVLRLSPFFHLISSFYCIFFCFSQVRQLDAWAARKIPKLPKFLRHGNCPSKGIISNKQLVPQAEPENQTEPTSMLLHVLHHLPRLLSSFILWDEVLPDLCFGQCLVA